MQKYWLKEKSSLDPAKYKTDDPRKGFSLPKAQKVIKTERQKTLYHHTAWHMVKAKIKQAYGRYLEDLLGINKTISNDQELIQSAPAPCPQNQKGNN